MAGFAGRGRKLAFLLITSLVLLVGSDAAIRQVRESRQRELESRPDYRAYRERLVELRRFYAATRRPAHPYRNENIPLAVHVLRGIRYRFNAQGQRDDREVSLDPVPGSFRVALLGDSVAQGLYVPVEAACARVIEREAGAGGRAVQVLNFSVDGLDTFDHFHMLEQRARPFRPNAVILLVCLNDLFDDRRIAGPVPEPHLVDRLRGSVALLDFVADRLERHLTGAGGLPSAIHWEAFEENFRAIAKLLRGRAVPLVVGVTPLHLEDGSDRYEALARRVLALARAEGARTADLWAEFRGHSPERTFPTPGESFLYPRDFWHPTAEGHELMGRALAREVAALAGR